MRRKVFNVAAALSLVLFVASSVFWVRGYYVNDEFSHEGFEDVGDRSYWTEDFIRTGKGEIGFFHLVQHQVRDPNVYIDRKAEVSPFHRAWGPPQYPTAGFRVKERPVWGGFEYFYHTRPDPGHTRPATYAWELIVPNWALCLVTAALPTIWFLRLLLFRRRLVAGQCRVCGYDLRATPDRCPECGTVTIPP